MTTMIFDSINTAGFLMEFLGTLIVSFDLIQANNQIEDLHGSYWGENLYIKEYKYDERNKLKLGLFFLASGFGLQAGIALSESWFGIVLGFAFLVIAVLLIMIWQPFQSNKHEKIRKKVKRKVLYNIFETLETEFKQLKNTGKFNQQAFAQRKANIMQNTLYGDDYYHKILFNIDPEYQDKFQQTNNFDEVLILVQRLKKSIK